MTSMQSSKTGLRSLWCSWHRGQPSPHVQCLRPQFRHQSTILNRDNLPRILQPSLWQSVIPPSLRSKTKEVFTKGDKRPTNPASFFIWIYLFIGSQAIRIVSVKNDYQTYSRKADLQIDKLREVVRKLLAGEEVDVERVLGTDVPEEEEAWEQALREIENEERVWQSSKKEKKEQEERKAAEQQREAENLRDASPVNAAAASIQTESSSDLISTESTFSAVRQPPRAPGFY